ncbi:MAG: NAD(P)/FAD-dependent oxidoreductase, partial [Candidatus Eremiobacterota bacterium]
MSKVRVVIVGAGFGGLSVAKALRGARNLSVTLIDRQNHHLFQPLLYQVATAGLNPSEIASAVRAVTWRQKNLHVLMGELTSLDYAARTVELDDGKMTVPFDYLVLAMGGRTSYFGHDEWAQHAPGLKSLQDALTIRNRALFSFERAERTSDAALRERLMTIVVVGGGPTGVELAGAFAELRRYVLRWDFKNINPDQARVILIEGSDRLLSTYPQHLSDYALKRLRAMGVEVLFQERVQDIAQGKVTTDKRTIEAENILWAAGVGGLPIAEKLSDDRDRANRIFVEADLRAKGHDNVYCIGDMAHFEHPGVWGGKPLPGVAPVAMQQGQRAGKNILLQIKGQPTRPFKYFDKGSMATIGRTAAIAEAFGITMRGLLAWAAWLFIHLMFLVDFQNRVQVFMRWTWAYFTWK